MISPRSASALARVADLVGERSRARILLALADGRALPASALAQRSGIAASTASSHLTKLVDGGLLRVEVYGRHRYYRLATVEIAAALEGLASLSAPGSSLSGRQRTLSWGRTCYDHLAGKLGCAVMCALLDSGVIVGGDGVFRPEEAVADRLSAPGRDIRYILSPDGRRLLVERLGIEIPRGGRRPLVRYCVDWSEQRHHLSGALGAALLNHCVEHQWLRRYPGHRGVSLTGQGERMLAERLGVCIPERDGY
jgi:DNA-binding transcriptional ArsR family regulator